MFFGDTKTPVTHVKMHIYEFISKNGVFILIDLFALGDEFSVIKDRSF